MFQFDPTTGSVVLPLWMSATLAAVLVVLAVLALARSGAVKTLAIVFAVVVVAYGGWAGSMLLDRAGTNDRLAERRVFDQRTGELISRAMAAGSPLVCLDAAAGDQVDAACEKVLFGAPETIAAAVSYTTARLSLLAEGLDEASRNDLSYDSSLAALRRGLENDRYGIVAHVLLQQENCTAESCEALSLLSDPNRVRANLQDKPFEALVARYAATWPASAHAAQPVAEAPRNGGVAAAPAPSGVPVSSKYDFPSSASIPPVSIMNSEPSAPPQSAPPPTTGTTAPAAAAAPPAAAAPATATATRSPPVPPRRPPAARAPVARAPAPSTASSASSPVQLTPAPAAAPSQPGQ